jgi:hypothetical protein
MRSEAIVIVKTLMVVFWDVMLWTCRWAPIFQRNILPTSSGLKMEEMFL